MDYGLTATLLYCCALQVYYFVLLNRQWQSRAARGLTLYTKSDFHCFGALVVGSRDPGSAICAGLACPGAWALALIIAIA